MQVYEMELVLEMAFSVSYLIEIFRVRDRARRSVVLRMDQSLHQEATVNTKDKSGKVKLEDPTIYGNCRVGAQGR